MTNTKNLKSMRLLRIWTILRGETDEDHPMNTARLLQRLAEYGIECDRRTLYRDIAMLTTQGFEVMKHRTAANQYYVSDREFDIPEIRILMDAVQAASFVTAKKTAQLVDKLAALAGLKSAQVLKQNIVQFNSTKGSNECIYYIVDTISTAINTHKKLKFRYFEHDENHERVYCRKGKYYYVNPVATINADGNYYLVCYDDYHLTLASYRVDRMDDVSIKRYDILENETTKKFDVIRHRRQLFGMFVGEPVRVTFEAEREIMDPIFDVFGEDLVVRKDDNGRLQFAAEVQISPTFFGWVATFGGKLRLVGSEDIVRRYAAFLSQAMPAVPRD